MNLKSILCLHLEPLICELIGHIFETAEVVPLRTHPELSVPRTGGNFDLIILEAMLADGDGLELCRKLRERDASTPILLVAGGASITEEQIRLAGAQALVVKGPRFVRDIEFAVKNLFRN